MVLGSFWGVRQFYFVGVDLGQCVDGFWWFSESLAIFLCGGLIRGTVIDGFMWFLGDLGNFPL
jgi:hypothetical protein